MVLGRDRRGVDRVASRAAGVVGDDDPVGEVAAQGRESDGVHRRGEQEQRWAVGGDVGEVAVDVVGHRLGSGADGPGGRGVRHGAHRALLARVRCCYDPPRPAGLIGEALGEPGQHELEAPRHLRAEGVARPEDVHPGHLGEVGQGVGRQRREHGLGERGDVVARLEGERHLLQDVAVDVGVEQRERVRGELHREAGRAQAADDGVVVAQGRLARVHPRVHQADGPRVPQQALASGHRAPAHLARPVVAGPGEVELGEDVVDHPVEQRLLVGDVVVERHRLDPQLRAPASASRAWPARRGRRARRPWSRCRRG